MKQVYSVFEPSEAHIVKGVLEANGIKCEVQGENLASLRGQLPMTSDTAPAVWVLDDTQYDEARALIKEYEQSKMQGPKETEPWICQLCDEESEDQFTECWNCGASRIAD